MEAAKSERNSGLVVVKKSNKSDRQAVWTDVFTISFNSKQNLFAEDSKGI